MFWAKWKLSIFNLLDPLSGHVIQLTIVDSHVLSWDMGQMDVFASLLIGTKTLLRGVLGDWIFALVYSGVTVSKLRSQMESATRPMNAAWSDQLSIFSFSWYLDWHSHAEVLNCCLLNKAHVSATCEPRFSLASEIIFQYDLQIAFLWNHDRPGQYLLNSTGFTAQSYN